MSEHTAISLLQRAFTAAKLPPKLEQDIGAFLQAAMDTAFDAEAETTISRLTADLELAKKLGTNEGFKIIAGLKAERDALRSLERAARSYFNYAVQDEAADPECCVDYEQHHRAQQFRDALEDVAALATTSDTDADGRGTA